MAGRVWADRGQSIELEWTSSEDGANPQWVGVSRLGNIRIAAPALSVWLQLRGCCRISSSEGSFLLKRGDWITFASGSMPELQSDRSGLTLGLVLPAETVRLMTAHQDHLPLIGRGRMQRHDLNASLRIWRNSSLRFVSRVSPSSVDRATTRPFLLHVSHLQRELALQLGRCPGRQHRRRREVFETLQRARLYLEGNAHRVVRFAELAELTHYSSWYFSKTFKCVYKESLQAAAFRFRLQRACDLLENTSLAITEIGAACGFSSIATFARAFRSGQGTTASNYRHIAHRPDWLRSSAPLQVDALAASS